jgi:hypothetical protein
VQPDRMGLKQLKAELHRRHRSTQVRGDLVFVIIIITTTTTTVVVRVVVPCGRRGQYRSHYRHHHPPPPPHHHHHHHRRRRRPCPRQGQSKAECVDGLRKLMGEESLCHVATCESMMMMMMMMMVIMMMLMMMMMRGRASEADGRGEPMPRGHL